ncbi:MULTISPECIES: TMEM175 family protein [unclassified Mesorhizobium]|uniref:TMEM175 family protein n=1 Tax=unclassified Mesorhizobium TaxID=325217 RepID=UPI00333E00C2
MGKGRVEAFTDGVVAIIITIMVLELKVPHGEDFSALLPLWPIFFSYVLSFINVGIYWNNLHNMFHTVQRVDGRVLWANLNLLFWLSLMPATTAFMGENHFAPVPVAVYGIDLVLCAVAYTFLATKLHHLHGNDTAFAKALGNDRKGKISVASTPPPSRLPSSTNGSALRSSCWWPPSGSFRTRVFRGCWKSSVGRLYLRIAFSFSATDAARSA